MGGFGNRNEAYLIGKLGHDPEIRHTPSGKTVANFTIATEHSFKREGQSTWSTETTWHYIVCWGTLAEFAGRFFRKGALVAVVGRIDNHSYEKDGQRVWRSRIQASDVQLLREAGRGHQADAPPAPIEESGGAPAEDDEVPF